METSPITRVQKLSSAGHERSLLRADRKLYSVRTFTHRAFTLAARGDRLGITITRLGLIIVLFWIGGLKAFDYEAEGIIPFVANSPLMSFFLSNPSQYAAHKTAEGSFIAANRNWHERNHSYIFARSLGAVILAFGLLLCLHPWWPQGAALGGFMVYGMSCITLSFLITTPEAWVPAHGGANHGFPFLSGAGRLVIKDAIMLGASMVVMADSAKAYLRKLTASAATILS